MIKRLRHALKKRSHWKLSSTTQVPNATCECNSSLDILASIFRPNTNSSNATHAGRDCPLHLLHRCCCHLSASSVSIHPWHLRLKYRFSNDLVVPFSSLHIAYTRRFHVPSMRVTSRNLPSEKARSHVYNGALPCPTDIPKTTTLMRSTSHRSVPFRILFRPESSPQTLFHIIVSVHFISTHDVDYTGHESFQRYIHLSRIRKKKKRDRTKKKHREMLPFFLSQTKKTIYPQPLFETRKKRNLDLFDKIRVIRP